MSLLAFKYLNIGSGEDYKIGWINLDYNTIYKVDINHDLDIFPYPFNNEEIDHIYVSHVLEHVHDLFKTLHELQRITKVGGTIHVRVPHFSNGNGYNDLSHKRFFGWFTFDQIFSGYYKERFDLKIVSRRFNFLSVNHPILNFVFSYPINFISKRFYERFLCWIFPVGEIELVLKKTTR